MINKSHNCILIISVVLCIAFGYGFKYRPLIMDSLLEFESGTLNGVSLGGKVDLIDKFGFPPNAHFMAIDEYRYTSSGFGYLVDKIEGKKQEVMVLAFECVFFDYWNLGYSGSNLDLTYKNKKLRVTNRTTKKEIVSFLGEPESFEKQKQLTILHYFFDKFYYEIDFFSDGKISYIHAYLMK